MAAPTAAPSMTPAPVAAPIAPPATPPIAAPSATWGLFAHAPSIAVLPSTKAIRDFCIALSPVLLVRRNMRTPPPSTGGGTCYSRRNEDCGTTFRRRHMFQGWLSDVTQKAMPRSRLRQVRLMLWGLIVVAGVGAVALYLLPAEQTHT